MYYSSGLEYIVDSYSSNSYSGVGYFSRNIDNNYDFRLDNPIIFETKYAGNSRKTIQYRTEHEYKVIPYTNHSFAPEIFLSLSRPKARFIEDDNEIKNFVEETFELMMKEKLPGNISINILPFDEFKAIHSRFGAWSNGILGFSINGDDKQIFAVENHLDALMMVIGHEIGHVLTDALPNKHDEEAKAFAFSIEWAKNIKKHNIANLGLSIKDELDFQPARNGLHDVAFSFVGIMLNKGRRAIDLHSDLVKKYTSIFDKLYF